MLHFQVSYKGNFKPRRVNLWLHNEHYDVIKSLKGFYASNFYCENCEKPFARLEEHCCANSCRICGRRDCTKGNQKRCKDCFRLCVSEECFKAHKEKSGNQESSLCDKVRDIYKCYIF